MTTLHGFGSVLLRHFGHFLLGSHKFMVTALGSCVKWPLGMAYGSVTTLVIPISEGGFNDEYEKLVVVMLNFFTL